MQRRELDTPDLQYLIFDTVKDHILAEFNILDSASTVLFEPRDTLSKLWSFVNGEGEGPRRPGDTSDDRPPGPN